MLQGSSISTQELISLRAKAHALRLPTHRSELLAGGDLSTILGQGMEYAESRKYAEGDDARTIDWRVTARTGTAHTKVFLEDRKRTVHLIVDMRQSMRFGTRLAFKSVVAAETASVLAWAAHYSGDLVSVMAMTHQGVSVIRPAASVGGVVQQLRMLSSMSQGAVDELNQKPQLKLSAAVKRIRAGDLTVAVSDFADLPSDSIKAMEFLGRRFMIACWVMDRTEITALPYGNYPITDASSFSRIQLSSAAQVKTMQNMLDERRARIVNTLKRIGASVVELRPGDDVIRVLYKTFHRGARRKRYSVMNTRSVSGIRRKSQIAADV